MEGVKRYCVRLLNHNEQWTEEFQKVNHHFKWWFAFAPPKGHCYRSSYRVVSQAFLLVRL